jgi:serine/threonine protein kinase
VASRANPSKPHRPCLLPAGELFNYLLLSQFEEKLSRTYYSQLLEALAHAHAKGIAHRDLKPENLLLDGQFNLRVADWGLSAVLEDVRSALLRTQCGTVRGRGRGAAGSGGARVPELAL